MSKFKGDTFRFPDEVQVNVKNEDSETKVEFEIEGQEPEKVSKKVEKQEPEIEIVDDTPPTETQYDTKNKHVEDPTEEELDTYSSNVRKRIEKLTYARRDEERAKQVALNEKQELEKLAQSFVEENRRLQEYVQSGEQAYMEKVQTLAKIELDNAKSKLKQAYDAGDSEALASAQEEMMLAGMKVQQTQNFRPTPLQQQNDVVQSAQTAPAPAAPKLDPKTSAWIERNSWFGDGKEKAMSAYAMGLHQELVDKYGEDFARTDEYFTQIDDTMRRTFPNKFKSDSDDEPNVRDTPRNKPATVVAPANRVTSAKKIRLTQTQVSLAKRLGVPLEVYAKHVAAMENK
jgi:hypothetical protein